MMAATLFTLVLSVVGWPPRTASVPISFWFVPMILKYWEEAYIL